MDLKPCPFCGGEPIVTLMYGSGRCIAQCKKCKCRTDYYDTARQAVDAWNKRMEA